MRVRAAELGVKLTVDQALKVWAEVREEMEWRSRPIENHEFLKLVKRAAHHHLGAAATDMAKPPAAEQLTTTGTSVIIAIRCNRDELPGNAKGKGIEAHAPAPVDSEYHP